MDWISMASWAMAGFFSVLVFHWIAKPKKPSSHEPKLYCSLCWKEGSYRDIYDHVRLDHGLWSPLTSEAYPDLVRLGVNVAAALNKNGEVYMREVWTTYAVEKSVLVLSPPIMKSLSEITSDEFYNLLRIYG